MLDDLSRPAKVREPLRWRLLKAFTIVLAIVCSAPGIDAVARALSPPPQAAVAAVGIDSRAIVTGANPLKALDDLDDLGGSFGDVPDAFLTEIGFLESARDVRCSPDGSIVSYIVDHSAYETSAALDRSLAEKGWTAVSLQGVEGSTFVKREGACTWALATCTQVGEATTVVIRCVIS